MKALPMALLLTSIATAMANGVTARADTRYSDGVVTRTRVTTTVRAPRLMFTHVPQWQQVQGTQVFMVRDPDRPAFDMFRHDGVYYIYDDGNWFRADQWNGRYQWLDARNVPGAFAGVPEAEWQTYPAGWTYSETTLRRDPRDPSVLYEQRRTIVPNPSVEWRSAPQWRMVPGTQVSMARNSNNYDMFRVGSTYYIYADNGEWYRANLWNGQYLRVDSRNVPVAIARVPEREWRSYPSEWASLNGAATTTIRSEIVRDYRYAPPAPRIDMRTTTTWRMIPGTQVYAATNNMADFDLFRVGNTFYLYDNGYWYRSNRLSGTFISTSEARVPRAFVRVPSTEWRHGPPSWTTLPPSERGGSYSYR